MATATTFKVGAAFGGLRWFRCLTAAVTAPLALLQMLRNSVLRQHTRPRKQVRKGGDPALLDGPPSGREHVDVAEEKFFAVGAPKHFVGREAAMRAGEGRTSQSRSACNVRGAGARKRRRWDPDAPLNAG